MYQIKIQRVLDANWSEWGGAMTAIVKSDCAGCQSLPNRHHYQATLQGLTVPYSVVLPEIAVIYKLEIIWKEGNTSIP